MKMKSLRTLLLVAAMALPALPASATVPAPLVLNFTYYAQVSENLDGNGNVHGVVQAARLDSKALLKLLSLETGIIFPKGAKIIIYPDGDSAVVDKHGEFIVDTTELLFADFGNSLFDGFFNVNTDHEKSNIFMTFTLTLDLPEQGLFLEMTGLARENFKASKPDKNDNQKQKGSIKVNVSGQGALEEELILGDGTVKLNGKETVNVD